MAQEQEDEGVSSRVEVAVAAVGSGVFASTFGLNYGIDNQTCYMMTALKLVHPELYKRDWLLNETTMYHVGFKPVAALLIAMNAKGWAVGIAHMIVLTTGMLCMYALLRALVGRPAALPAHLLLLAFAVATRTFSAGVSYVFDWILQPTTLASLFFLMALPFFARGRWLASGACVALSGLFHANYLVLLGAAFGVAHLFLGRQGLLQRLVLQLVLPSVVLLFFLPMILKTAVSPHAAEAQALYFNMRSPHHYVPANFERDFTPYIAWNLIGVGAGLHILRRSVRAQRIGALIAATSALIWLGLVGSTLVHVRSLTSLMAWRLNPHCELMLQALACAGAVTLVIDPAERRRMRPSDLLLVVVGLGLLAMNGGDRNQPLVAELALAIAGGVLVVQLVSLAARELPTIRIQPRLASMWRDMGPALATACAIPAFVAGAAGPMSTIQQRMLVVHGLPRPDEELFAWMRDKSPVDAIFLTPPRAETMRFWGQRAIVVDWKSVPMVPDEVLAWHQRLKDVTGRPNFSNVGDLDGYRSMDQARLESLKSRYSVDFVVLQRGQEGALRGYPVAYSNAAWVVLDLRKTS